MPDPVTAHPACHCPRDDRRDPRPRVRGREVPARRRARRGGARDLVERLLRRTIARRARDRGGHRGRRRLARPGGPGRRRGRRRAAGGAAVPGLNPSLHEARAAATGDAPPRRSRRTSAGVTPDVALAPPRRGRRRRLTDSGPRPRSARPRDERPRCSTRRDVIDPAFGGDSRAAHAWLASPADAAFVEVDGVLDLDVDTPEDLLLARRAPTGGDPVSTEPARVEVIALAGLPEVRAGRRPRGDDRRRARGDRRRASRSQPGDVLVVTQKIVSKAEGAVVDLRRSSRGPRPIEWADEWDRDARQIEVVLQRGPARRPHGARRADHRDAPRVRVRERRRRRLERRTGLRRRRDPAARRPRRVGGADPGRAPDPVRRGPPGHRLGQLRAAVALGHRRRRARRVRASSRSRTSGASPTPMAG